MERYKYMGHNLVELARTELSDDFIMNFCLGLPDVYKNSYDYAYGYFGPAQAKDLLPHIRRAKTEEHLEKTASGFGNLNTDTCLNTAKNCRHVWLLSETIVLTANAVTGPREMVRPAIFRDTLAESNQLDIFPDPNKKHLGTACYSMILHGPQELEPTRVGFVCLVFPSSDSKSYLYRCNLLELLEIKLYPSLAEEKIHDNSFPELKKNISIQEG